MPGKPSAQEFLQRELAALPDPAEGETTEMEINIAEPGTLLEHTIARTVLREG